MTSHAFPKPHKVNMKQPPLAKSALRKAKGHTVLVLTADSPKDEKCVVDRAYFEKMLQQMRSLQETLEIMADEKLYRRLLRSKKTIKEDFRAGRLHSMEQVFGEA